MRNVHKPPIQPESQKSSLCLAGPFIPHMCFLFYGSPVTRPHDTSTHQTPHEAHMKGSKEGSSSHSLTHLSAFHPSQVRSHAHTNNTTKPPQIKRDHHMDGINQDIPSFQQSTHSGRSRLPSPPTPAFLHQSKERSRVQIPICHEKHP